MTSSSSLISSAAASSAAGAGPNWTCPFCGLLCDDLTVRVADGKRSLVSGHCTLAQAGLDALDVPDAPAHALIDGQPASADEAIAVAGQRLRLWRQPLFGGLGTDVAGARALYRLAASAQAICDHADGRSLMHGVRAQQDKGLFYTTLAEMRSRADLIVCVGTSVVDHYPCFFRRVGLGSDRTAEAGEGAEVVFVDVPVPHALPAGIAARHVAGSGDLFADLQQLSAALAAPGHDAGPWRALADRLGAARYAVLVWEAATLPDHGALIVEAINRVVGLLNRSTRAAMFSLGGGDGAYAVNQAFTWLSGLPLRTRVSRSALEHDPLRFDARRLLDRGAVDGLLWLSSFRPDRLPPETALPTIVLGPVAMGARLAAQGAVANTVFIAVATPGVNAAGHLFRSDGGIVLPLQALRDDGLPSAAEVLTRLDALVRGVPV